VNFHPVGHNNEPEVWSRFVLASRCNYSVGIQADNAIDAVMSIGNCQSLVKLVIG